MADQNFRPRRSRRRPRRLRRRDPCRTARHEDRGGGARTSRRHLPQLGLHSRPRRCCAPPRSTTCCTTCRTSVSPPVEPRFEIDKVVKRSRAVAKQLSQGVAFLLRKHKVTVFDGSGKLAGKQTLAVEKDGKPVATLKSPHIILATGARARQLPGIEADGKLIWSYKEAMVPPAMPKSLLVIGSGAIGIEFASFYRNMGAKVTVVEVLPRILPVEDEEISAFAHKAFEKQGIRIHGRRSGEGREERPRQRRCNRGGRRQEPGHHGGSGDLRRRHRRQRRGDRPGRHRREGRSHACRRSTNTAAPASLAFMRSAISLDRRGSRTRRATRAWSASRRSPA